MWPSGKAARMLSILFLESWAQRRTAPQLKGFQTFLSRNSIRGDIMVILHKMECCLVESTPEVTFLHIILICCWPPHTVSQKGFLRSASFLVRMPMRSVPDARQPGNGNIRNTVTDVDKDFPGQNMTRRKWATELNPQTLKISITYYPYDTRDALAVSRIIGDRGA